MEINIEKIIDEVVPELSERGRPRKVGFIEGLKRVWSGWFYASDKHTQGASGASENKCLCVSALTLTPVGVVVAIMTHFTAWWEILLGFGLGALSGVIYMFVVGLIVAFITGQMREEKDWGAFSEWGSKYFGHILYFLMFPLLLIPSYYLSGTLVHLLPLFPLIPWVGETIYLMLKAKRVVDAYVPAIPPSVDQVHLRILNWMKKEVAKGKSQIVGQGSVFENRIAEIKARRDKANVVWKRYTVKAKSGSGSESVTFQGYADEAEEVVRLLDEELRLLDKDQREVLEWFSTVEAFIPAETQRIEDDELLVTLRELQGIARTARSVSRDMLIEIVGPSLDKLSHLNVARERLLSHSVAALQPVSVERFIEQTEKGVDSVIRVEGALRQIEQRARGLMS